MKSASAAKVAARFDDYLQVSREHPVLVTRNGKPVAVLLGVRNKREAEKLASPPRSLRSVFKQAHDQIEHGDGIPHEEFWKHVAKSRAAKRKTRPRSRQN